MADVFAPIMSLAPYLGALLVLLAMPAAVIPKLRDED